MSFDPENECFKQVEQDMMHRLQTFFNEKITGLVTVKDRSILEERNRFDSLNESMLEIQNENVALEKEIERLQKLSENDSHTINDLGSQVFHKDAEIMALKNKVIASNQQLNILANENCALKLQLQRNIYFIPPSQVQSQQSNFRICNRHVLSNRHVLVNALNQQLARMKTELDSKYSEIQKLKQQNELLTQSMKNTQTTLLIEENEINHNSLIDSQAEEIESLKQKINEFKLNSDLSKTDKTQTNDSEIQKFKLLLNEKDSEIYQLLKGKDNPNSGSRGILCINYIV